MQTKLPTVSWRDTALCKQALWFIYSRTRPPASNFRCGWFKSMLASMIPVDHQYSGKPPLLGFRMLKRFVNAEYERMIHELQSLIRIKKEQSMGNKFGQLIHDGCTLKNGVKVQSIGLQFVDPNFTANHIVTLCCRVCKESTGKKVADFIKCASIQVAGQDLSDICDVSIQDRAALSVANELGITEAEACDMHDGDKIGRSAIGELTRSKNKVVVNPFPEGKALMLKFQGLAKHFVQAKVHRDNYDIILERNPNIPKTKIQRDLNSTRIEARHLLAKSAMRIKKGIEHYSVAHSPVGFPTAHEWNSLREVEGVLNSVHPIVILSQCETKFVAAYGPYIKSCAYRRLCEDKMNLINLDEWGKKKHPPRIGESISEFTALGKVRNNIMFACDVLFDSN